MGTVLCQHESAPVDTCETLGSELELPTLYTDEGTLPTLLTEDSGMSKRASSQEMAKGSMEHDDASIASEGKTSLRQEVSEAPLLPETCQEPLSLVVVVLGAKGLREADWLPGTQRYFHTVLRTCPGRQGKPACQTKAVKDVVDAMNDVVDANWAEEDGIMEAQYVAGDSLQFDVVDTDGDGNSGLLGRAFLDAGRFSERGFIGELPLEGAGAIFGTAATLSVEIMQPGQTRQVSLKEAAIARDPRDHGDHRDPRSSLFALIKEGKPSRRHRRAEAFARKRIW